MTVSRRLPPDPIKRAFLRYHAANPHVYDELVRAAREYIAATGARRLGIALLVEHLRYEYGIRTKSDDGYKISNNHRALYSRLMMKREADLRGVFLTKPRGRERRRR